MGLGQPSAVGAVLEDLFQIHVSGILFRRVLWLMYSFELMPRPRPCEKKVQPEKVAIYINFT